MNIDNLNFDGSVDEIATQLFHKLIGPMFDNVAKKSPALAVEFGFCVTGNAIACYLNSLSNEQLIEAEATLIELTKTMAADILQSRQKVC